MKLHHAFLIALGIATPLWVRQYRVEQCQAIWRRALEREIAGWVDRMVKSHNETVAEINKAFEPDLPANQQEKGR